jgi:hypothetical protein
MASQACGSGKREFGSRKCEKQEGEKLIFIMAKFPGL